ESSYRAVPVFVLFLKSFQLVIVCVFFRQFAPQLMHQVQRFGPTLVAVAADHIVRQEIAVRMQRAANLVEQQLQFNEMVERLKREDHMIWTFGTPSVHIEGREREMSRKILLFRGCAALFK